MPLRNRPWSCPSPPEVAPGSRRGPVSFGARRGRGYAFLILLLVLTLMLISLAAAVPDIMTQGRREREEELIFRGEQYARAIALFHRQFNRYPTSIEELVKRTNGYRFLRHAYRDPMTRNGKWRLIHATAAGAVLDSKILAPPGSQQGSKPGENGQPGQGTQEGSGNSPQGAGGFSLGGGQQPGQPSQGGNQGTSSFSGSAGMGMQGAFIVGVASTSTEKSIRVFEDQDEYDKWEFLGIPTINGSANPILPASEQPSAPGAQGSPRPSPPHPPGSSFSEQ
jgi:type II secretory pathway pseudopilin PulG